MIDDKTLLEIANSIGPESFVFDADEVCARAEEIKKIMNENLPSGTQINLCFSIKANPFLIPVLSDYVDYFEVCSPGELSICMAEKVSGSKIIYSGVHKDDWDILEAVKYGAAVLTAESIRHYELEKEAANKCNKEVSVILRLSSQSQFGMSKEDIEYIIEDAIKNPSNVKIDGIHYFAGTQREKLKHQRKEMQMLEEFVKGLRDKYGIKLEWLEYGPGLSYHYFEGEDMTDTLAPLKELAEDLQGLAKWSSLTVEMGRFLASSCGTYLTKIYDIKTSFDNNWCILGGGINHVNYLGQMMGLKIPVIKFLSSDQRNDNDEEKGAYTLCGSLCTTNDVLVRDIKMNKPQIGDILAFENIGAYSVTEGINLFLSRTMPKVAIYSCGKTEVIRDRIESWKLNH